MLEVYPELFLEFLLELYSIQTDGFTPLVLFLNPFARNYGMTFAEPYKYEVFDFGDEEYRNTIKYFTKDAPIGNEPRGSQHFLYTTRVHLGLYNLLMKMGHRSILPKAKRY